jgi:WD40 repeat protein
VAIAGHILAAGTASGQIHFWDLQSGSQQVLADYFSQDVTQLIFHPGNRAHLCAGSYDGLVCLIDTSIPLDDDAILDVLNVGTSVAKMGLFGPENQFLYTLAPTEQLQVWSLENSSKVSDFGFELREHLSSLCSEEINYIIDCKYDYESSTLLLFAGSFSGLISVFSVSADNNFHFLTKLKGHSAIVRDIWFAPHGCTAVTIGEDSMLHYWTSADGSNLGSAKPASEPNFSSTQRTKPY